MPIQYTGILNEHRHTREQVSVFDICHMGQIWCKGSRAGEHLEMLVTRKASDLKPGRSRYALLLNEQGTIEDDLIFYRVHEEEFLVVTNAATHAKVLAWFQEQLPSETVVEDASNETGKIDLQGPMSAETLRQVCRFDLSSLKYFRVVETTVAEVPCLLSRTGYTGELGYELYLPANRTAEVWERLLAIAPVQPAGLGARDTLRLEVGYPLSGQDIGPETNPVQARATRFVDLDHEFVGKSSVLKTLEQQPDRLLVGLRLQGRQAARHGQAILSTDGAPVGTITSGAFAPSLGVAIALGYVDTNWADTDTSLLVDTGRNQLPAQVTQDTLFYKSGTIRAQV